MDQGFDRGAIKKVAVVHTADATKTGMAMVEMSRTTLANCLLSPKYSK